MQWHLHACTNTACMCACMCRVRTHCCPRISAETWCWSQKAWVLLAGHGWVAGSVSVVTQRWESRQRELVEWCKETERLLYSALTLQHCFSLCVLCQLWAPTVLSPLHLSFLPPPCLTLSLISRFLSHSLCIKRIGSQKETERERERAAVGIVQSLWEGHQEKGRGGGGLFVYCSTALTRAAFPKSTVKPKYIVDPLETQPRLVQNNCTSMFSFAILTMH